MASPKHLFAVKILPLALDDCVFNDSVVSYFILSFMASYRNVTRKDWTRTLLYVCVAALFVSGSGFALASRFWPLGLILWALVFAGGSLFLLVRWHAKTTAYRCPECSNEFEISTVTDFVSPHLPNRTFLKCPKCGRRRWATILVRQ